MNVKNVVKVMNFHSLLRVDKSRRDAEKFFKVEKELKEMIASIYNNRNIQLDKKSISFFGSKKELDIYIGSDLGFCGAYNYVVKTSANAEQESDKIIIGKKVIKDYSNVVMSINKEDFFEDRSSIIKYVSDAVSKKKYCKINVLFNNYLNTSQIEWSKVKIFPFDFDDDEFKNMVFNEDFVFETDIDELLSNMITTFLDFEILILVKNSFASENIMRQNATNESLKKINEREDVKKFNHFKEKREFSSKTTVENYIKLLVGERV